MSLTTCFKKAGKALDPDDKLSILTRAKALRDEGMAAEAAGRQAVDERLAEVEGLLAAAEKEDAAASEPVAEPMPDYTDGYETDLFGDPLPEAQRKAGATRPDAARIRRDSQPVAAVPSDTQAPAGEYHVRTAVGVTQQRKLGAAVIKTAADAAAATRYLYRSAVERMDGIVTDKDGKPLAVIGGFKGALAQAAVYPATLVGEAVRIPGAARVWFSHNHPGGTAALSRADEQINQVLSDVFRGSGIEPMGTMAIAGDKFAHVDASGANFDGGDIPTGAGSVTVSVIERELAPGPPPKWQIGGVGDAKNAAKAMYDAAKTPGLILLNTQHGIIGWVPVGGTSMMGPLRNTGGLNAIYRAVSEANAGAAILVHGGEMSAKVPGSNDVTVGENIGAALKRVDVKAVDIVNAVDMTSAAERGASTGHGPVFSRRSASPEPAQRQASIQTPATVDSVRAAVRTLVNGLGLMPNRLGRVVVTTSEEIKTQWEPLIGPVSLESESEGSAMGFYDPKSKTVFLIADRIPAGQEMAVAAHELMHKHGRQVLGDDGWNRLHGAIESWKTAPEGSRERAVYDEAAQSVAASMPDGADARDYSTEELFPYAVQAALSQGVKPSMLAKQGTVARWLSDVRRALREVWAKVFGKARADQFDAQDLVNLAFGIAQRENPAHRGELDAATRGDQTETPEFRRWFGDSKVVDAEGRPLVVYHGTRGNFSEMKPSRDGGIYASSNPDEASAFSGDWRGSAVEGQTYNRGGANVLPLYLSLQNPAELDFEGELHDPAPIEAAIRQAKTDGHDGLIVRNIQNFDGGEISDSYIAFRPEQIKSATGNRGTFDPKNPDIRYSRAGDAAAVLRQAVPQKAQDWLTDAMTSQRGLNRWWHRTVGTQLHKAKINPAFGRVFYAVQGFMKDVSRMATHAADLAPDMLTQVDDLSSLSRIAPTLVNPAAYKRRKADIEAASKALFDGTSRFIRDEDGKPVPVPEENKAAAGLVWTDEELKGRGMSDKAIAMYRQAREAIGLSLDSLMAADVYRTLSMMRPEDIAQRDADYTALLGRLREAAASTSPRDVLTQVEAAIDARIGALDASLGGQPNQHTAGQQEKRDALMKMKADIAEKAGRVDELKANGYAPLMRFGPYVVDVKNSDGDRVAFRMFDSQIRANREARSLREQGYQVTQSTKSEREFKLLQGLSPDVAMMFAEMLGVDKNAAMQEWLQHAVAEQSALKRRIHRKNVEGFNEDGQRVMAAFIVSNARAAARGLHSTEIKNAVESIAQGDVKDEAIALTEYIDDPKEEAQTVRGLLFVNYIGGSVASALVNMTQTAVQTFPFLAQYGGAVKAAARVGAAMKTALSKNIDDKDLAAAVKMAAEEGTIKPQEVFHLQAEASRALGSNLYARSALAVWGSMFQAAETYNRRVAFIAAYQTAKAEGMADPMAFARDAVDQTQGVFNKGNRPDWARGAVGSTIFTFKAFTIQYVEFLKRLPTKERALALFVLVVLSGLRGIPFADDAEDIIDTIAQGLGYNWSTKDQMNRWATATAGAGWAEVMQSGISGLSGMPFDVSARLGMADLLPGTGLLKKSETRKEDQVLEAFGVAGSFVRDALKGEVRPIAARNIGKALDILDTGMYRDTRGRKVIDADGVDAFMKALGLQPADVARESRAISRQHETRTLFNVVKGEISEQLALGRFEGDPAKVDAAKAALDRWNTNNPDTPIRINNAAVMRRVLEMRRDRRERFIRSSPREIRAQIAEAL